MRGFARRASWLLVIGCALALSWWSLYTLAHGRYGLPTLLAAVVSAVFDGGALLTGELSLGAAQQGDSALGARAAMLAEVGASAWLNWQHAVLSGYGAPGRVLYAAPPLVAGFLAELWTRAERRAALRRAGRIAPALPPFGTAAAVLHPFMVVRKVYMITGSRIRSVPATVMDWTPAISGPAASATAALQAAAPAVTATPQPAGQVDANGVKMAVKPAADMARKAIDPAAYPAVHVAVEPDGPGEVQDVEQVAATATDRIRRRRLRRPPRTAPDAAWLPLAAEVLAAGERPSARELAGRVPGLSRERAGRLLPMLAAAHPTTPAPAGVQEEQ